MAPEIDVVSCIWKYELMASELVTTASVPQEDPEAAPFGGAFNDLSQSQPRQLQGHRYEIWSRDSHMLVSENPPGTREA